LFVATRTATRENGVDPSNLKVASILITGILGILAWTLQNVLKEGRARVVAVRATLFGGVAGTLIALLSQHVEGVKREEARIAADRKEQQLLEQQQALLEQVIRTTYRFSDVGVDLLQFDLDLQSSGLQDLGARLEGRLQNCAKAKPKPDVDPFTTEACRDFDSNVMWPSGFLAYEVRKSSDLLIAETEPLVTLLRNPEIRVMLFPPGGNKPEIELTARPRDIRFTFLNADVGPDRLRVTFVDSEVQSRRDGAKVRSVLDLKGLGVRAELVPRNGTEFAATFQLQASILADSGILTLRFDRHPLTITAGPKQAGAPRGTLMAGTIASPVF
jgi:hypothetical protein